MKSGTYEPVLFKNNKRKIFREHIKTPDWIKNSKKQKTKGGSNEKKHT